MSDIQSRVAQYDELLRRFASGVRAAQLYAADHPLIGRNVEGLLAVLKQLHTLQASIAIGIVGSHFVVSDTPMSKASLGMSELIKRLRDNKIERISFERGIASEETAAFIHAVAMLGKNAAADAAWSFPHIRVGRIVTEDRPSDGISGDIAAIRQLYSKAVTNPLLRRMSESSPTSPTNGSTSRKRGSSAKRPRASEPSLTSITPTDST